MSDLPTGMPQAILVRLDNSEKKETTMSFITSNDLKHLLTPVEGDVCVSLYQATHMT